MAHTVFISYAASDKDIANKAISLVTNDIEQENKILAAG